MASVYKIIFLSILGLVVSACTNSDNSQKVSLENGLYWLEYKLIFSDKKGENFKKGIFKLVNENGKIKLVNSKNEKFPILGQIKKNQFIAKLNDAGGTADFVGEISGENTIQGTISGKTTNSKVTLAGTFKLYPKVASEEENKTNSKETASMGTGDRNDQQRRNDGMDKEPAYSDRKSSSRKYSNQRYSDQPYSGQKSSNRRNRDNSTQYDRRSENSRSGRASDYDQPGYGYSDSIFLDYEQEEGAYSRSRSERHSTYESQGHDHGQDRGTSASHNRVLEKQTGHNHSHSKGTHTGQVTDKIKPPGHQHADNKRAGDARSGKVPAGHGHDEKKHVAKPNVDEKHADHEQAHGKKANKKLETQRARLKTLEKQLVQARHTMLHTKTPADKNKYHALLKRVKFLRKQVKAADTGNPHKNKHEAGHKKQEAAEALKHKH